MNRKKPYFPMFIDISEKTIVVAGGGMVAERRVETLLRFAGEITVIAPEATDKIQKRADEGKICWIKQSFCQDTKESLLDITKLLKTADMVLAATNDTDCNEWIMRMCREYGIPVNVSHKKELCDFFFPAVVVKDNVTVGITSGGMNHMQARKVREQIEDVLDGEICHAHSLSEDTDDA